MKRASERADAAYQTLHRAIIEQALEPGTKLREDQLGAHFGISRTLVRIALARLVGEGLVERRHRRSAMVARPTLKDLLLAPEPRFEGGLPYPQRGGLRRRQPKALD